MSDKYEVIRQDVMDLRKALDRHERGCTERYSSVDKTIERIKSDTHYMRLATDQHADSIKALNTKMNRFVIALVVLVVVVGGDELGRLISLVI